MYVLMVTRLVGIMVLIALLAGCGRQGGLPKPGTEKSAKAELPRDPLATEPELPAIVVGGNHLDDSFNYPLSKTDRDDRPPFHLDSTQPFLIELGRGSGLDGLNTVKIGQDGAVVFHRLKQKLQGERVVQSWERASFHLQQGAMVQIVEAVEANRLLELHKGYHADVADGTQWVLWIKQGKRQKSVYFNNHFPKQIIRFAQKLDAILAESGSGKLKWKAVRADLARQHERELWDSIK
jgi:predicted small lipoprotein YifL